MSKAARQEKVRAFAAVCRENGIRLTHQRLELFREIAMDTSHPSVEEVYRRIRPRIPTISLDTVYRTLSTFESFGLIRRLEILDDRTRFDSNPHPHGHLVCTVCKKVEDIDWPAFEKAKLPPCARGWGHVESRHIEIRGTCSACLKKDPRASGK